MRVAFVRALLVPVLLVTAAGCGSKKNAAGVGGFAGFGGDPGVDGDGGVAGDDGSAGGSGDGGVNPNDPANFSKDTDCDGLSDGTELSRTYGPMRMKTDAANPDSDGDGLPDGLEIGVTMAVPNAQCASGVSFDADPATQTDPLKADSDDDLLPDGCEDKNKNGQRDPGETSPLSRDSDTDGIPDGEEDANHNCRLDPAETDPADRDTDADGLTDGAERQLGTNATQADTDMDGLTDAEEFGFGTNPLVRDSDMDGLTDAQEIRGDLTAMPPIPASQTDPLSPDTDRDGLSDGEEHMLGTNPISPDSDMDGITDGDEVHGNPTHVPPIPMSNPLNPDSDGDGLSDGIEGQLGTSPTDANNPPPAGREGAAAVCSTANLQPVTLTDDVMGDYRVALLPQFQYVSVQPMAADTRAGVFDSTADGVAGFVVSLPTPGASMDPPAVSGAVSAKMSTTQGIVAAGSGVRNPGRNVMSLDGFPSMFETSFQMTFAAAVDAPSARNAMLRALTGGALTGLPAAGGPTDTVWVARFSTIVRSTTRTIVVGALVRASVVDTPPASGTDGLLLARSIGDGTSVARAKAPVDATCEQKKITRLPMADFLVMSDVSTSTDNDRAIISANSGLVFNALREAQIDFRIAVITSERSHCNLPLPTGVTAGSLLAPGFLGCTPADAAGCDASRTQLIQLMANVGTQDYREYGLTAIYDALNVNGPSFRTGAKPVVLYVSDEHPQEFEDGFPGDVPGAPPGAFPTGCVFPTTGCGGNGPPASNTRCNAPTSMTPTQGTNFGTDLASWRACQAAIVDPYVAQLRGKSALAFGILNPVTPTPCTCSTGNPPDENEAGIGYLDVINALGGSSTGVCSPAPQQFLNDMVAAVAGATSEATLSQRPISATLKVSISRASPIMDCPGGPATTCVVPRSRSNGFDYDPVANSVFFRGAPRIAINDLVTISYRVWLPPPPACQPPLVNDPMTGRCVCPSDCGQMGGCGDNRVCNLGTCECRCLPGCNGTCGAQQLCDTTSCSCQCAPDCGGACTGNKRCDTASCACTCPSDCGGACTGLNKCDTSTCSCQCPMNCDNKCQTGEFCNMSTCTCDAIPG